MAELGRGARDLAARRGAGVRVVARGVGAHEGLALQVTRRALSGRATERGRGVAATGPYTFVSCVRGAQTGDEPSGAVASAGQLGAVPVQVSCGSQTPVLARQTVLAEANWQDEVQQSSLLGSHTAFCTNLQVVGSQHELLPHPLVPPQSQSSPVSTMPLPHWLPVMVAMSLLAVKHVVLTLLRPMALQMLPTLQAENLVMPDPVAGFMMNCPPASQVSALRGQHCCAATVLPSLQVVDVQSCTAPKVWPVSWAMTCHSVEVRTTTLAELTVSLPDEEDDVVAVLTQAWPNHASPTADPVAQVLSKVQYAFVSLRSPRQPEKRFSLSWIVVVPQAIFQGADAGAVAGHAASLMVRFCSPSVMLKLSSYCTEAELICVMMFDRAASWEAKSAVYVQSVATPINATFRVVGHPLVSPIVLVKLTPAPLPLVCPSICRPESLLVEIDPNIPISLFAIALYTG